MRKALALGTVALSFAGLAVTAAPASAAACSSAEVTAGTCTTVSLTVVDGLLTILVTPTAAGTSAPITGTTGTSTDIVLGATTVSDTRLSSTGWTAKATSTALTPLTGSAPAIATTAHSFFVPPVTTVVTGDTLNYRGTSATPVGSGVDLLSVSHAAGPALAPFVYTPTMRVAVPAGQLGGVYTGTVTQSVS